MKNMVDERFECISVIFRLAEGVNYCGSESDYEKEVAEKFAEFKNHEAVEYTKNTLNSYLGYDAVFKFAVHIEKQDGGFVFIEDIGSLFDGRWNDGRAEAFLPLFNKFYADTNYAEFYNSKTAYFEELTGKFIDETYSKIDLYWFAKYVDPSNLRCICTLSSGNYGATLNDKIIYCLIYFGTDAPIVHEYCHSFANPLAKKWYDENAEFRKWCDDSVDMEKMPFYGGGGTMANEYVTRAYNILYEVRHGAELEQELIKEKNHGWENTFPYIEEVYKMVLNLEK